MIDPELPASPPPQRPRRSSYASYAQPVPPLTADGDPASGESLPYIGWAGSAVSADGSPGGVLPRQPSAGGHVQPASSAASEAIRTDGVGTHSGHSDARQGSANGLGGVWPAASAPSEGFTRAGTAPGKAGSQARSLLIVKFDSAT